ncbi:MAG: hypothetical protein JWQ23_4197, partial [Herminiimonas sp.]|nr:hypothetical protein [Herminiimonas sp.]
SQQRPSAAPRLDFTRFAIRIGGKLLLVALELRPANVAFMMIFNVNFRRIGAISFSA